jgi:hypothetical protein
MTNNDWLDKFPAKRIKPVDGLAVTAAVWEEAHDYHRSVQRFHNLLGHGPGVLIGLEVIASDPPDTFVNILPGVAIGTDGQVIAMTEPVAYDVGPAQGALRLLISYGEGPPRAEGERGADTGLLYVHAAFGIEAQPGLAAGSGVELARVQRQDRDTPISDAQDPEYPVLNEIDLRFRRRPGDPSRQFAAMALCTVGGPRNEWHRQGARHLGRALRYAGKTQLWTDDDVPLGPGLEGYSLVYLVGQGQFDLGTEEVAALEEHLQNGGTVFMESCRRESTDAEAPSDAAFLELADALGVRLQPVRPDHPLLNEPHLFARPATGFVAAGEPRLLAGEGVIFSSHDYGCLWQGECQDGPPSRGRIRAGHEWGANLVTYALRRRSGAGS